MLSIYDTDRMLAHPTGFEPVTSAFGEAPDDAVSFRKRGPALGGQIICHSGIDSKRRKVQQTQKSFLIMRGEELPGKSIELP